MATDESETVIESLDATFDGEIEDLDLPDDIKERAMIIRDSLISG